jgi:hypothetical protein
MFISKLYIPTYDRVGSQACFDSLPVKWKEKTVLVVHPEEIHDGYPTLSCSVQGTGIAPVRQWISKYAEGTRYGVIDDDCVFQYTLRENEEGPSNRPLTDEEFDVMIDLFDSWMNEGFTFVGSDAAWNPPTRDKDYRTNSRLSGNVFYSEKLPVSNLDWLSLPISEDYYVALQLLTQGYQNRVSLKYRINPGTTQAKGGCSTQRTLDSHNESLVKLREKFPAFVQLREKIAKSSGEWSGKTKLAATILWKKAYHSSQINSLEEFFT